MIAVSNIAHVAGFEAEAVRPLLPVLSSRAPSTEPRSFRPNWHDASYAQPLPSLCLVLAFFPFPRVLTHHPMRTARRWLHRPMLLQDELWPLDSRDFANIKSYGTADREHEKRGHLAPASISRTETRQRLPPRSTVRLPFCSINAKFSALRVWLLCKPHEECFLPS